MDRIIVALIGILCISSDVWGASPLIIQTKTGRYQMYEQSKVLIIGQSKYNPKNWDGLEVVPKEVQMISKVFADQNFEVSVKENLERDELLNSIRDFLNQDVNRSTRLVLYFAGHGWSDGDFVPYIVPVDAGKEEQPGFKSSLVNIQEIKQWAANAKAKHILLVFNSCFSGSLFATRSGYKASELYLRTADTKARQIMTSGGHKEKVPDRLDFANAFKEALDGQADTSGDGLVSALELFTYVRNVMIDRGLTVPKFGSDQIDRDGEVIFKAKSDTSFAKLVSIDPGVLSPKAKVILTRGSPAKPESSVFSGVDVVYYEKIKDRDRVETALTNKDIPFTKMQAILPRDLAVNAIGCGRDVPIQAVKDIATALLKNDVPLQAIITFTKPELKPQRIELLTLTDSSSRNFSLLAPKLTLNQIEAMKECPQALHNTKLIAQRQSVPKRNTKDFWDEVNNFFGIKE